MKEKVIKNTNLLGGWGGRGSLTLLADEFKKSKLVLGLKELRFKNSHQVSYKGGLWKEIIWYSLILWFFHSKNWSIFNEIRARIFEKLQHKKFIMASSKGNHQCDAESEYTGHNWFHLDCLPSATYCMAAPFAIRLEICQKNYTTRFLGQKLYTLKMGKLWRLLLKRNDVNAVISFILVDFC